MVQYAQQKIVARLSFCCVVANVNDRREQRYTTKQEQQFLINIRRKPTDFGGVNFFTPQENAAGRNRQRIWF
ncbi:MAG: hypothetical protein H6937_09085 [Burkholderiales bacterium]|nr:hypothetical protein [Burkholderiales bacterium]